MKISAVLICLVSIALGGCSQGEKTTLTYPSGMRKAEGYLSENGKEGSWTYWDEEGRIAKKVEYENGRELLETRYRYYENGQKEVEGGYKDGKVVGRWTTWYENGQKRGKGEAKNGEQEGLWTLWHENGQKREEGEYKDGSKVGQWTYWDENGKKESVVDYKDGVRVDAKEAGYAALMAGDHAIAVSLIDEALAASGLSDQDYAELRLARCEALAYLDGPKAEAEFKSLVKGGAEIGVKQYSLIVGALIGANAPVNAINVVDMGVRAFPDDDKMAELLEKVKEIAVTDPAALDALKGMGYLR